MIGGHRLALIGVALGLAGAYTGARLVASSVYENATNDPAILVIAAALANRDHACGHNDSGDLCLSFAKMLSTDRYCVQQPLPTGSGRD